MQYAASFASISVIVILIAYTVQTTVQQVNKVQPFAAGREASHSAQLLTALPETRPTVFQVDKANSKLTWTAKKVTGQHTGHINISNGALNLDNNTLAGGSFELDTRSISVTDITEVETNAKLVGHLKGDDFFAVEKFPAASFTITSAAPKAKGEYDIKGKLTIKGITNDVSFPATVAVNNEKLTAKALVKIDRTEYDIKFRSKSFFENLGDKVIYDDFYLDIVLVASAQ